MLVSHDFKGDTAKSRLLSAGRILILLSVVAQSPEILVIHYNACYGGSEAGPGKYD